MIEQHESGQQRQVVVYGASGYAYGIASCLRYGPGQAHIADVAAFIDDFRGGQGHELRGRPVLSFQQWADGFRHLPVLVGIADTSARRRLVERVSAAGGRFERLYDRLPEWQFPDVSIGPGSFVAPATFITPLTTLGAHVQLMNNCAIGHDVVIGDCCTICPSTTISGYVVLEDGVFLGAGTIVAPGREGRPLVIGRGATVSAGAVVTKSVPPGATVAGNPARPLRDIAQERIQLLRNAAAA